MNAIAGQRAFVFAVDAQRLCLLFVSGPEANVMLIFCGDVGNSCTEHTGAQNCNLLRHAFRALLSQRTIPQQQIDYMALTN